MRRLFTLITLITLLTQACKKDSSKPAPPKTTTISSISVNGEIVTDSYEARSGERLNFTAILTDTSIGLTDYQWNVDGSVLTNNGKSAIYNVYQYGIGAVHLNVKASNPDGSEASKTITINCVTPDFRWCRWGDKSFRAVLNEAPYTIQTVNASSTQLLIRTNNPFNESQQFGSVAGDVIGYNFNDGKLVSGGIISSQISKLDYPHDFYGDYDQWKSRLAGATLISEEANWQDSYSGNYYKNHPNEWGSAIRGGYVDFKAIYETDRSRLTLTIGKINGQVNIGLVYMPK